jgi:hypothetical protein
MLDSKICIFYLENFKFFLLSYAVGSYIFLENVFLHNQWAIISLIVFVVILSLPLHFLLKCDLDGVNEYDILKKEYESCVLDFPTNYDRQNPITKRKGDHRYLERLKEAEYITDQQYCEFCEKMIDEDLNMLEIYYRNSADIRIREKNKISNNFLKSYNEKRKTIDINLFNNALSANNKNSISMHYRDSKFNLNKNRKTAIFNFMRDSRLINSKLNSKNDVILNNQIFNSRHLEIIPIAVNANKLPINNNDLYPNFISNLQYDDYKIQYPNNSDNPINYEKHNEINYTFTGLKTNQNNMDNFNQVPTGPNYNYDENYDH